MELSVTHEEQLGTSQQLPVHYLGDFTPSQLFEALRSRGLGAGEVPHAIREMLLLPVLTGIYATLALERPDWNPQNEYRVLEAFWDRGRRLGGRLAGARLKALARILVAQRRTSASDDEVAALGFGETELEALIAAGWLSDVAGRWSFAHDRLLTWAIAMSLVGDAELGSHDGGSLAQIVSDLQARNEDRTRLSGLGFLLMDVIWLAAGLPAWTDDLVTFLMAFEPEEKTGSHKLYGELIHTAGRRILPAIEARIVRLKGSESLIEGDLVLGLRQLEMDGPERAALCARLWSDKEGAGRSIAVSLGRLWPLTEHRDELWASYVALNNAADAVDLFDRMQRALDLLAARDPSWVARLIADAEDHDPLWLAAFLLRSLEPEQGGAIWQVVRAKLIEVIPVRHQTVLVECVDRFGGASDQIYLEQRVRAGDPTSPNALAALAGFDPDAALTLIESGFPGCALHHDRGWMDQLLDYDRHRTTIAIRALLLDRDGNGDALANLWSGLEERIDGATISLLLDCLAARIDDLPLERARRVPLLDLLGSLTLDPALDPLFAARSSTALADAIARRAMAKFDGQRDEHHVAIRRILRRIGGKPYEAFALRALAGETPVAAREGVSTSVFVPTPAVIARLEHLATLPPVLAKDDTPLLDLWRALLNIRPDVWRPRLLDLLASDDEASILLSLALLPEYRGLDDEARILACFERSVPGGAVEERTMILAYELGVPPAPMVARALDRLHTLPRSEVSQGTLFALFEDRSPAVIAALDAYVAPVEGGRSWSSLDEAVVAVRVRQGNAGPILWRLAERMMRHLFLAGDQFIEALLDHDPSRAMDVLLDRAFATPDMLTSAQPDAISLLAKMNRPLATQAFVRSWREHPERRQYLAPCAAGLESPALEAMIASLAEDERISGRAVHRHLSYVVFRDRAPDALAMLLARYRGAPSAERAELAWAISWADPDGGVIADLRTSETDRSVRRVLDKVWRHWRNVADAVANFRSDPTLERMEYVIDIAAPEVLRDPHGPFWIIDLIRNDARLIGFAERQFARRLNELSGTRYKRAVVRQRPKAALASDVAPVETTV